MFVDSHCHINSEDFDADREDVVARAREMKVKYIDSLVQGHNAKQCQNQDLYPSPPEL